MTARALVDRLITKLGEDMEDADCNGDSALFDISYRGVLLLRRVLRWLPADALRQCGNCGAEYAGERCPCGHWPAKGAA